uniref:Centrosomal protein of 78 kDa n=1 Tax=Cuerna arida TaxID=1464854 RepID=A0A1B6GKY4_9HEMI
MVDMIPSVQERKKNVHNFMNSYPYLCRLQNLVPNPSIKIDSSIFVLDFFGDRLKVEDWKPVLEAISNDRSLHFISIRSKHTKVKVIQDVDTDGQGKQRVPGTPKSLPLFTSSVLVKIVEALSKCLTSSPALTGLLLEKVPLKGSLTHLNQGLEVCQNLQQLALPYTHIGDDDCATLCHVLRHRLNLVWLNLTGCALTEKGVSVLCNLLKFQKLNRYGESWKQSLRYRLVNPNVMPGLRRLTLNNNPIGDAGVKIFVETIIDDLWLKALDLQHCDITAEGGEALLNLVKENEYLSVVDVRGNAQVPTSLVGAIVQQLSENNGDTTPEFQWLKEDEWKGSQGSRSVLSMRSSRRPLSSTLSSKGLAALPNKTNFCLPTRSSSATKRSQTTNNSPRLPWNYNSSNTSLRRGKSDQLIPTNKNLCPDVLTEVRSIKDQLQDLSKKLDEERERRIKLEKKLDELKINLPDNCSSEERLALQSIFSKLCNAYFAGKTEITSNRSNQVQEGDIYNNLETVIKTINGESRPTVEANMNESTTGTSVSDSSEGQNNVQDPPSRAQLLFESLISSVKNR